MVLVPPPVVKIRREEGVNFLSFLPLSTFLEEGDVIEKKLKYLVIAIVAIVAAAVSLGVYYTAYVPMPVKAKEEILIGYPVHLSGAYAYEGTYILHGVILAVEDINAKGGVYVREYGKKLPLKLIYEDTASDVEKTKMIVEKMITVDKVDLLIPPYGSTFGLATLPITEQYKKFTVGWSASAEERYTAGYKYAFDICTVNGLYSGVYFAGNIGFLAHYKEWLPPGAPPPLTVAILAHNAAYGRCAADVMEYLINRYGVQKVVLKELYDPKTTDFSPLITKIRSIRPDVVIFCGTAAGYLNFYKQVADMKVKEVKMWFPSNWYPEHIATLGWDRLQYFFDEQYWIEYKNPRSQALVKRADERWPGRYHELAWFASGYDAVYLMAQAVEKAGSLDPDALRTVMLTQTLDSILYGNITFTPQGYPFVPKYEERVPVRQVIGQRLVIVWPPHLKEGDVVYPPPWDKKYGI